MAEINKEGLERVEGYGEVDSKFTLGINGEMKEDFKALCKYHGKDATKMINGWIRAFIRSYWRDSIRK